MSPLTPAVPPRKSWIVLALAVSLAAPASAQLATGPDFRVNSYTTGGQDDPAVSVTPDGGFVVVWTSNGQGSPGSDIFGRRYTAYLVSPGELPRINSYTTLHQFGSAVAADATGRFVVVWQSGEQDGSGYGVFGQRFDAGGNRLGGEFQVNVYTTGGQYSPVVAAAPDGAFIIVWGGSGPGDESGIFARLYGPSGSPVGPPFRVNAWTTSWQVSPAVAASATGQFVVAWSSWAQYPDASEEGVFARRFSAAGAPQGPEFLVNASTWSKQSRPSLSMDARGNFAIAWEGLYPAIGGTDRGVFARVYDPFAVPRSPELRVNQYTTGSQGFPDVALGATGHFVVTWRSELQDGSEGGVFARHFERWGAAPGAEFRVNAYTTSDQRAPAVASQPGGRLLTTWASFGQDGSITGLYGRAFLTDLVFEDGFEESAFLSGSPWSARATDDGYDLTVTPLAALNGTTNGLRAIVDDTAALWVQDDSPQDEYRYGARFYFDTNGFDPGEALLHRRVRLFVAFEEDPARRLVTIVLRRLNGAYALMGRVRLDDGSRADTGFFPISDGVHWVELRWQKSSTAGSDGAFSFWIDGAMVASLDGLDNGDGRIDFARLGAISAKLGAAGTLYLDEFVSRRFDTIGP
jgi:hypothetical protein